MLGLLKGCAAEKQASDECIQNLENKTETLVIENTRLRERLEVLEAGREEVFQREQEMKNQRVALAQDAEDRSQLGNVVRLFK